MEHTNNHLFSNRLFILLKGAIFLISLYKYYYKPTLSRIIALIQIEIDNVNEFALEQLQIIEPDFKSE